MKVTATMLARLENIGCVDPYTCADYLKHKFTARQGIIYLNLRRKLYEEKQDRQLAFLTKQYSKNWLQRLLGL